MSNSLKSVFVAALLLGTAIVSPVMAQSDEDLRSRMDQMEEQMRQLVGQVEQLNYTVKQLQTQLGAAKKSGDAGAAATPPALQPSQPSQPAVQSRKLAQLPADAGSGVEQIQDQAAAAPAAEEPMYTTVVGADGSETQVPMRKAPGPKMLGTLRAAAAAAPNDGGFQGKVLVPPGGDTADGTGQVAADPSADSADAGAVQTVALAPETPESLYERSNESLLRRQFSDAEVGFRSFIEKYPDHNLAGSAQYWLGETFYAEGDYRQAAQNFLTGYKQYPKSRRAPDSLFKLGVSLNKLGQKQQACASFTAVGSEFPNAVDVKKRAQTEFRRAGC